MDNLINSIGQQIRILRKSNNLSQENLAFQAEVHPTFIGQIERGEKNITISTLKQITDALEISLEEFFSFIDPIKKNNNAELPSDKSYPYQNIIKALQDIDVDEQKMLLEIIQKLIQWKKAWSYFGINRYF